MTNEPKVLLIHGFEGTPNGGWRPWLMGKLGLLDVYACALPMPTPAMPKKEEWISEIAHAAGTPSENIFLVGHSLGVPAILHYLQTLPEGAKIGGAVLVSGPFTKPEGNEYEPIKNFFEPAFDFAKIKASCKNFTVIHGDNDPIVVFSDAEIFSKELFCKLVTIPNGRHLNGSSGWRELPAALEALEGFFKS